MTRRVLLQRLEDFWLIPVSIFVFLVLAFINSERATPVGATGDELPAREDLVRKYYESKNIVMVYGRSARYRQFAEAYRDRLKEWIGVRLIPDSAVVADSLKGTPVFIVGTPSANRAVSLVSEGLPVSFSDGDFTFNKKVFDDRNDVLSLFFPNPIDPEYPLRLATGNDDLAIYDFLSGRSLFGMAGDYQVFRNGKSVVFGLFDQRPGRRWEFDPSNHRDFEEEKSGTHATAHFSFVLHGINLDDGDLAGIYKAREKVFTAIESFFGEKFNTPTIEYHLYASCEDKGLMLRDTRVSHSDPVDHRVHTAIEPGFRGDDGMEEARVILHDRLGSPKTQALETGLAVRFSSGWRKKGYEYWAAKLFVSDNLASLTDLIDNTMFGKESELVMTAMAGSFVGYLIKTWGRDLFLERYLDWTPTLQEIKELEQGWLNDLEKVAVGYEEKFDEDRASFPKVDGFRKGFCHAHEGYAIYNGYVSRKSDLALAQLASLGTNSVSITPFSYMQDPGKPNFLPFVRGAGAENDESVIHSALCAERLGMSVMLKPHIWLSRSWPGDVSMNSEKEWDAFFEYYYRWIRHYALMAEMYGMESLCVGVELAKATVGREQDWAVIVKKLRKLYSGKLTYAANWGEEFENVAFWDLFDFIGLNCYYPLSGEDQPTDEELKLGFEKIKERIKTVHKKVDKPVVLTEIGFTSTPDPWKEPHKDGRGRTLDLESQERCYRIVFEALKDEPWLSGIYWWKWPSYVEYGGPYSRGFTPCGKPAEQVVAYWYSREW